MIDVLPSEPALSPDDLDPAMGTYRQERMAHWDAVAKWRAQGKGLGGYYHRRLEEVYRFHVPAGRRVLEIGCSDGDLLAAMKPSYGVGIDLSTEMLHLARRRHPHLNFIQADAHDLRCIQEP